MSGSVGTTGRGPGKARFTFVTQQPNDGGCGVVALQMLTGLSFAEIASMIDWGTRRGSPHHLEGREARPPARLGWTVATPRRVNAWQRITGVALVHVKEDHFMLYDAENRLFYDPAQWQGPDATTMQVPISYASRAGCRASVGA